MAYVDGKISFPERRGVTPEVGEVWEVSVSGQNPKGTVNFLCLVKKVEMVEWTWNNGMASRSRYPACLVISPDGKVHNFSGDDIEGVVKVVNSQFKKNGKWSNTDYSCISPDGTKIHSWYQSWGEAVYWPEASWEEAIKTVQTAAPHAKPESIEAVIRQNWNRAAKKFDENRTTLDVFSKGGEPVNWTWNDGMASRGRQPACLIVTPDGKVHRFHGSDIDGVVKVTKEKYNKNGKWSNTDYSCISPFGTTTYQWSQSWDNGVYWPQSSWEEAIQTVQQAAAPHATPKSIEEVIRQEWGKAAEKLDDNRSAINSNGLLK
jgi:hypothetical protein